MNISKAIDELNERGIELKEELINTIKGLPTNPHTEKISKNMFIISSKNLNNKWSAEYHNFEYQYEKLINIIKMENVTKIPHIFNTIIQKGFIKYRSLTIQFHPLVIKEIKNLT